MQAAAGAPAPAQPDQASPSRQPPARRRIAAAPAARPDVARAAARRPPRCRPELPPPAAAAAAAAAGATVPPDEPPLPPALDPPDPPLPAEEPPLPPAPPLPDGPAVAASPARAPRTTSPPSIATAHVRRGTAVGRWGRRRGGAVFAVGGAHLGGAEVGEADLFVAQHAPVVQAAVDARLEVVGAGAVVPGVGPARVVEQHRAVGDLADGQRHAAAVAVDHLHLGHHPDADELGQVGGAPGADAPVDGQGAGPRGQRHHRRCLIGLDLHDVREAGRPLEAGGQLELPAVVDRLAVVGDDVRRARPDLGALAIGGPAAVVVLVHVGVEHEHVLLQLVVERLGDVVDHVTAIGQLGGVVAADQVVGAAGAVGAGQVARLGHRGGQHQADENSESSRHCSDFSRCLSAG